jgi:hypothetical protein
MISSGRGKVFLQGERWKKMHGIALRPVNPDHLHTIDRGPSRLSLAIPSRGQSVGGRMVLPPPLAVLLVGHVASAELTNFVTLKRAWTNRKLMNVVTANRAWTDRSNQD